MASILASTLSKTTDAAHSAFAALLSATQIAPGSPVPDIDVKINSPEEHINFAKLKGKNVIVLVPAAFSPSCSETHVPGYLAKASEFASKGVDNIYVLAVNDAFVTKAWGKTFASNNESGKVKFVADDHGAFASATGLIFDASAFLGGPRAKRAALVIENGKVTHVAVEQNPPEVTVSSAESTLAAL